MLITELNAATTEKLIAVQCHEVVLAALEVDFPGDPLPMWQDTQYQLTETSEPHTERLVTVLRDSDQAPVRAWAIHTTWPDENAHKAETALVVHPAYRRRGYGTALVEHGLARFRTSGRTLLSLWGKENSPAHRFAQSFGLYEVQTEFLCLLDIASVSEDLLITELEKGHSGYRLAYWTDTVPSAYHASYAAVKFQLADAPIGESATKPTQWTNNDLDYWLTHSKKGKHLYLVAVIEETTQQVVAVCELEVSRWSPYRAHQAVTVVDRQHRGHGLGRWMKAAQLRWLRTEHPEVREIESWNNADNTPMLDVNFHFGFHASYRELELQGKIADIPAPL